MLLNASGTPRRRQQSHYLPLFMKSVCFEGLTPVFFFPPHDLLFHVPFSDSDFNVPSHVPSWGRALHLVFTVKMVAHVRRPCCGPALPSKEAHSYALNVEHGKAVCVSFGELQKFLPHVLRGMSRLCSTVHHLVTGGTVNSGDGWDFHHLYQRRRWRTCELAYFSTL